QPKIESAIAAGERIAPEVEVVGHQLRLGENFVDVVGAVQPDIVVDGSDSFDTRFVVDDGAARLGVPVVFGALMQWSAQITVFDAAGTYGPAVRLTDIFPDTPHVRATPGCAEMGILGSVAGMVGTMLATETVKLIVGTGRNLVGRMLVVDALDMQVTEIPLAQPDPQDNVRVMAVSTEVLDQDDPPMVIDVRRAEEIVEHPAPMPVVHVPFDQLGDVGETVAPGSKIVTLCRTGPRSVRAAQALAEAGYQVVGYLDGGVEALQNEASVR
ncbi:MAG: ThiF family adenylyltransferase, partial [Yaniella sp.]|nr:ThiF family adenylyltransferase [Yaniella sp.]